MQGREPKSFNVLCEGPPHKLNDYLYPTLKLVVAVLVGFAVEVTEMVQTQIFCLGKPLIFILVILS
jgi:hypothetical protein